MPKLRRQLSIAAFSIVVSACASIPLASPERNEAAKQFAPVSGKAVLYVTQNGGYLNSRALHQVFVDGKAAGSLTGWTYHRLVLDAGEHSIVVSSPENEKVLDVSIESGGICYVGMSSTMGWAHGRVGQLRILTAERGQSDIRAARLAEGFTRSR